MNRYACILAAVLAQASAQAAEQAVPRCHLGARQAELANDEFSVSYSVAADTPVPAQIADLTRHRSTELQGELFELVLRDGKVLRGSDFKLQAPLQCVAVPGNAQASRAAARQSAEELRGTLIERDGRLTVRWSARLIAGGRYVREVFALSSASDIDITSLSLISLELPGSHIAGTADGTPIISGDTYFAFEHPLARALITNGHATSTIKRRLPLRAGVTAEYAAVVGVTSPGQLRRDFAAYLELERAHPFRTYLHYNSWYDIGYFSRYDEADALAVIERYGEELVRARHVVLDSFLFDDGWDNTTRLWEFNAGFPQGFARIREAAAAIGSAPGVWLSPWGGYGPPRRERLASAAAAGYEIDDQGIALSGARYYRRFHEATVALVRDSGVNQFKLDGLGSPDKVTPGSTFDSDYAAAIALIEDLREVRPDLYINLTTGTWPSPFWLRTADSIWRGGEDHEFAGTGSDRQRWITYRDADTYGGIVRQSPLYPLNALMLHGIIYAQHARGLDSDPGADFGDEVWSYFASGTGLQELYVSPNLLQPRDWDLLARAARWARERAPVLRDSHWLGGDPARDEVYGWASWTPARAIVALRNPAPRVQTYLLELGVALELPESAQRVYTGTALHGQSPPRQLVADRPLRVTLGPHAVLVWDLTPATARGH